MRNQVSNTIGNVFDQMYHDGQLDPATFMASVPSAFDSYSEKTIRGTHHAFHVVHGGMVVTVYYSESRDTWYAKF